MTAFEMWIVGGLITAIVLLIGLNWNQLSKRIDLHEASTNEKIKDAMAHVGKHYSEISDLRVEQRELRTHINNHVSRLDAISKSIDSLHDLILNGLQDLNTKLDNWRERRQ